MKKILLIVGMILCVAVIGSVFAVSVFNASKTIQGTADNYIYLGFDGTADTAISLTAGQTYQYEVKLTVEQNAGKTGEFKIKCSNTSETVTLNDVTITVYTKNTYAAEDTVATDDSITVTKSGNDWTISGIAADTTYYVGLLLDKDASETQINNCGGSMKLTFDVVE